MQNQSEKKAYTTPTLTTHGEVVNVTQQIIVDGSNTRVEWRPRLHE